MPKRLPFALSFLTLLAAGGWGGYPKRSPFHAVRYPTPTTIDVQLADADTWYSLQSLNDLSTPDLIAACQSLEKKEWQRRFEEDLVEVLTRTHHTPPNPDSASLKLTNLTSQQTTTQQTPMTEANRRALYESRHATPASHPTSK